MTLILPESTKKITFETFLTWLEQLPDEQKQLISDRLRRNEFKKIQNDFLKLAQIVPNPNFSEADILSEIKAFRSGH